MGDFSVKQHNLVTFALALTIFMEGSQGERKIEET